ncbi:hypothetical protein H0H87_011919 [Tephrocybe sp. NHM501043]|nr:hypothetical protein H0H87_011919 [Tephrocybe sp. NHM501043]
MLPQKTPMQQTATVATKVGKTGFILGAAASGGFVEGMVQNVTPEVQKELAADPKGTITKMLPPNPFQKEKREYTDDLTERLPISKHSLGLLEGLIAQAIAELSLKNLE